MEETKNKSSLYLYFRFYTSFFSTGWKYFTLNYEDYRCEKYRCNYYKLTNNSELLEFIRFLLDRKYIVDFNSRSDQSCWLRVDGKKCKLMRDEIEVGIEFETTERIHDYFDEKYFLNKSK